MAPAYASPAKAKQACVAHPPATSTSSRTCALTTRSRATKTTSTSKFLSTSSRPHSAANLTSPHSTAAHDSKSPPARKARPSSNSKTTACPTYAEADAATNTSKSASACRQNYPKNKKNSSKNSARRNQKRDGFPEHFRYTIN